MKTVDELKTFFNEDLMADLKILEEQRKEVAKKAIKINVIFGIGCVLSFILFGVIKLFALIIFLPLAIFWFILSNKVTKNYKSDFKKRVIERIIKFIDSGLDYYPEEKIGLELYMSSELFKQHPDRYTGDDLVKGKIGQTIVEFSELHSEYKTRSSSGKGGSQEHWHTIFRGIFFIANFNKHFKGKTFVLPDVAQKTFGSFLGNMFQSWNKSRGELIKMEDPEFEKLFVVYGSDQIEARYLLSTSLMKRITEYKIKNNKEIYISFINNDVFIGISYLKNLFEPNLYKTLIDFSVIEEYYRDMTLAISIVDDLNLNTRIWG